MKELEGTHQPRGLQFPPVDDDGRFVYWLRQEGAVVYVGHSSSLYCRLIDHARGDSTYQPKMFDSWGAQEFPDEQSMELLTA